MDQKFDEMQKKLVSDKESLSKAIAEKISDIVEEAVDGLENAAESAKEALNDFDKCVDELKETLSDCGKIVNSIGTMDQKAQELSDKLLTADSDIKASTEETIETIRSCSDSLKCILTQGTIDIDKSLKTTIEHVEEYSGNICKSADKCVSEISESTECFQNIQTKLVSLSDKIVEARDDIERQCMEFSENISVGVESIENISRAFDITSSEAEVFANKFQLQSEKIEVMLNEFSQNTIRISENLSECELTLKTKFDNVAENLDLSLEKCIDRIYDMLKKFEENSGRVLSAFEKKCNESALQNESLQTDILCIKELLNSQTERINNNETKQTKRFYITFGITAVLIILSVLHFFI